MELDNQAVETESFSITRCGRTSTVWWSKSKHMKHVATLVAVPTLLSSKGRKDGRHVRIAEAKSFRIPTYVVGTT